MRRDQQLPKMAWLMRRGLCLGLLWIGLCRATVAARAADEIKQSTDRFQVAGKTIEVERFEPKAAGTYPAVIMLHGAEGLKKCGFMYRCGAQTLAKEGFIAFLVHYFDRTGTTEIAAADIKKEQFLAWMETVRAAFRYAAAQPGVDGKRIGIAGFSLGACLALAVAGPGDLPVAAVVDWFGSLPEELHQDCKRLPPTLIIHSEVDKTVPVAEARSLETLLHKRKVCCEIKIYQKPEHLFLNDPLGKDAQDARQRTLAFLAKHLKSPLAGPATHKSR